MTGLLEIGPVSKRVKFGNKTVEFFGLSAEDIFHLMGRFPEVEKILQNKATEITPTQLMRAGPEIVGAIVACANDMRGNVEAEMVARRLSFPKQLEVITAIFECTFEEGVGPFVEQVTAFIGRAEEVTREIERLTPETSSSVPATTSPGRLSASPEVDMGSVRPLRARRAS